MNLAHLLFISLTPSAASLIGHYEGDRVATIVFSADLGLASWSLIVLGQYVLAKEEWKTEDASGTWLKVHWWSVYAGPGLALVSILVSFMSIDVALLLWLLLPLRDLFVLGRESPGRTPSTVNDRHTDPFSVVPYSPVRPEDSIHKEDIYIMWLVCGKKMATHAHN